MYDAMVNTMHMSPEAEIKLASASSQLLNSKMMTEEDVKQWAEELI